MYWWGKYWVFGGMWIFIWIIVVVALIFFIKWLAQQSKSGPRESGESALDILKKRYARGEIDRKELEQKKKDLLS